MPRETNRFAAYLRARRARATLMAMDDRMLADIGIARGDIDRALAGRAQR